jgi:Spy/CpxP family protein refolding chaperone
MKRFSILIFIVLMPVIANAGEPDNTEPNCKHKHRLTKLTEVLSLTFEQQGQLEAIFHDQKVKIDALLEEEKNRFKAIKQEKENRINGILSEEQKVKYVEFTQQRRQAWKKKHHIDDESTAKSDS